MKKESKFSSEFDYCTNPADYFFNDILKISTILREFLSKPAFIEDPHKVFQLYLKIFQFGRRSCQNLARSNKINGTVRTGFSFNHVTWVEEKSYKYAR